MNGTPSNEAHIKCEILNYLRAKRYIDARAIIASEYVIGNTGRRADLVILKGSKLVGIEIKSRKDKLTRLRGQLDAYLTCFDEVMVVLDEYHVQIGLEIAPETVSVLEIKSDGTIIPLRAASRKPLINPIDRLQLLTTHELKKLSGRGANNQEKRRILIADIADQSVEITTNAIIDSFSRSFSATSRSFWSSVKYRKITSESLRNLSRFVADRANAQERRLKKADFWALWRTNAIETLQETRN